MRRTSVIALAVAGIGLALIRLSAIWHPVPLLVWNASASVPVGLYRAASGLPDRGDFVLVRTPDSVATLAAERGYLPVGVPLIKRIASMAGDRVCVVGLAVFINGQSVAEGLKADRAGRVLPHWRGCRRLAVGEIFLLANTTDSFDSRYFGPVPDTSVIGRLAPLWTE